MKYPNLKFVFDRRNVASLERLASVYLEVSFQRKRRDVPTGIRLFSNEWDDKKHVVNRIDSIELNTQLETTLSKVRKIMLKMQEEGEEFSLDKFDVYYKGLDNNGSFLDFMFDMIAKRPLTESTKRQHLVTYNMLVTFGKIQSFKDLTPTMIKAFDDHIRTDGVKKCQATIFNIHKRLKPYVREACERGYIKENPYDRFTVQAGKSKSREFLNMDEIEKIQSKSLNSQMDKIRDLFLFGCYTGMAYSDIENFNYEKDVVSSGGNYFIEAHRQKTNTSFYVMLLEPALKILKKYNNELPAISLQRYNTHLKTLGAFCGINKTLTSHLARHTFATTITLANDVPLEVVSRMLGHTNIKTTQIYAKVLNTSIERHMKELGQKMKKSKKKAAE